MEIGPAGFIVALLFLFAALAVTGVLIYVSFFIGYAIYGKLVPKSVKKKIPESWVVRTVTVCGVVLMWLYITSSKAPWN